VAVPVPSEPDEVGGCDAPEPVEPGGSNAVDDLMPSEGPGDSAMPPPSSAPEQEPGAATGGCEPVQCEAEAKAFAASFASEMTSPAPFLSATCSETGDCTCSRDDGALVLTQASEPVCLVPGRLMCLVGSDSYGGCTMDDPSLCQASCAEVQSSLEADAAGFEVTVRASGCGTSGCVYVVVSGDACFVAGSNLPPAEANCSLSDDELLNSH
jgi:hypothetical protein